MSRHCLIKLISCSAAQLKESSGQWQLRAEAPSIHAHIHPGFPQSKKRTLSSLPWLGALWTYSHIPNATGQGWDVPSRKPVSSLGMACALRFFWALGGLVAFAGLGSSYMCTQVCRPDPAMGPLFQNWWFSVCTVLLLHQSLTPVCGLASRPWPSMLCKPAVSWARREGLAVSADSGNVTGVQASATVHLVPLHTHCSSTATVGSNPFSTVGSWGLTHPAMAGIESFETNTSQMWFHI